MSEFFLWTDQQQVKQNGLFISENTIKFNILRNTCLQFVHFRHQMLPNNLTNQYNSEIHGSSHSFPDNMNSNDYLKTIISIPLKFPLHGLLVLKHSDEWEHYKLSRYLDKPNYIRRAPVRRWRLRGAHS